MNLLQLKTKKHLVEKILTKYPESKDDDLDLLARIWYIDLLKLGWVSESIIPLCQALKSGLLTPPDTIMRVRRKLQEVNPQMRGEAYIDRQNYSKKVKQKIVKL